MISSRHDVYNYTCGKELTSLAVYYRRVTSIYIIIAIGSGSMHSLRPSDSDHIASSNAIGISELVSDLRWEVHDVALYMCMENHKEQ